MLVDAAQLTENSRLEADVVIAGGGVAGIALARQLADTGLSVLVLESGGEKPEPRTQSLYEGTMTIGGPGQRSAAAQRLSGLFAAALLRRLRQRVGRQVRAARSRRLREARLDPALGLAHRSRRASAFLRSRVRAAGAAAFRRAAGECRRSGRTAARRSRRARSPFDHAVTRATQARRPAMPTRRSSDLPRITLASVSTCTRT